jgi:hypothetical protein
MQVDVAYIKTEVQRMRSLQPEICWRPAPDWVNACLLDIGHDGPCGWELAGFDAEVQANDRRLFDAINRTAHSDGADHGS